MKNLTLLTFLLLSIFVLTVSGCATHSDRDVAAEKKIEQEKCEDLDPHGPDQYFEEYERCRGL